MSFELKATVAVLALGNLLLGGCDARESGDDDGTPPAARGTYTFGDAPEGAFTFGSAGDVTFGSTGDVTFGSGGGVTLSSAGGGASAQGGSTPSTGSTGAEAAPGDTPAIDTPPSAQAGDEEEEERIPTSPTGPIGPVPPETEGEHWSAPLLRASWRFTDSPFSGYFQDLSAQGTAPVNLYRIALNEDDGQVWYTWFKDQALDEEGSGENCFRMVARHVLADAGDDVMRFIDDVGERENVTEFTLESYGVLQSHYRNTDQAAFITTELAPTFEGISANDLATCSPPAVEPEPGTDTGTPAETES